MGRHITIAVILATLTAAAACSPSPRETESITVAVANFESVGLFYVAEDRDMFAAHGIDVTIRGYETGVAALDAIVLGDADMAVGTSEYPLVAKAFDGAPVSAIACIDRPEFIYLIGRRDHGIAEPADLLGKRIGTAGGSIAEFYLGRFLELSGMTAEDVTVVDVKTSEAWRRAIFEGDVDAVVLAQPEASLIADALGENAALLSIQKSQPVYTLVVSSNEWIEQNPDAVTAFLDALADAEELAMTQPAELRAIIQERLGLEAEYMDLVETQNQFSLSLDQSLITAMEDEARWMMRNGMVSKTEMPDFSIYIHTDALKRVEPESVNIVR